MERGSDKHGPRIDEEMDHETQSIQKGSPAESRAQEFRQMEGPPEREPDEEAPLPEDVEAAEIEPEEPDAGPESGAPERQE